MGLFDGFAGGLASGAMSLVGGIMGNAANAKQAAKNRDFQAEQSSTAHQREVADLRAAGLNPILSGTGGSGASTSSGSTAQQNDVISPAISSALQAMRTFAETAKINAETLSEANKPQLLRDQAELANTGANLNRTNQLVSSQNLDKLQLETELLRLTIPQTVEGNRLKNAIAEQDLVSARGEAKRMLTEGQIDDTKYGKVMRYLDRLKNAVSPWSPNSRPMRGRH